MKRTTKKRIIKTFTCYIPVAVVTIIMLFPFYWFLNTSLKEQGSIMKLPVKYLPDPFTMDNYASMLSSMGFDKYFLNSLFVSIVTTIFVIAIAIMGGYAISRYKFRGKKFVFLLLLVTQMLPGVVILVPLFTIFNNMGLINNLWSLVIVNTTVNDYDQRFLFGSFPYIGGSGADRWMYDPKICI